MNSQEASASKKGLRTAVRLLKHKLHFISASQTPAQQVLAPVEKCSYTCHLNQYLNKMLI